MPRFIRPWAAETIGASGARRGPAGTTCGWTEPAAQLPIWLPHATSRLLVGSVTQDGQPVAIVLRPPGRQDPLVAVVSSPAHHTGYSFVPPARARAGADARGQPPLQHRVRRLRGLRPTQGAWRQSLRVTVDGLTGRSAQADLDGGRDAPQPCQRAPPLAGDRKRPYRGDEGAEREFLGGVDASALPDRDRSSHGEWVAVAQPQLRGPGSADARRLRAAVTRSRR